MDLAGYLRRIGHTGPVAPRVEVLHALSRAHAQSIPFESIDVLLRRPIRLEPDAVFAKLVTAHRGGYCFEQNGLLMSALEHIGFAVRPLRAGVRLSQPARSVPVGHTHLVLEVTAEDERWLVDVGVGSTSLTAALRLVEDEEQATPHDCRRLQREGDRWFQQIRRGEEWIDVCEFAEWSMALPDRIIASWYTSTHPASSFQRELVVARALPDGRRVSLRGRELAWREPNGEAVVECIEDADGLREALQRTFAIELDAADCMALMQHAWKLEAEPA